MRSWEFVTEDAQRLARPGGASQRKEAEGPACRVGGGAWLFPHAQSRLEWLEFKSPCGQLAERKAKARAFGLFGTLFKIVFFI